MSVLRPPTVAVVGAIAVVLAATSPSEARTLPSYDIVAGPQAGAARLAKRLGLSTQPGRSGLRFLSPARMRGVRYVKPTTRPASARAAAVEASRGAIDIPALKVTRLPPAAATTTTFLDALGDLGLRPSGRAVSRIDRTSVFRPDGTLVVRAPTARRIDITPSLSGIPVVGPRARVGASYDSKGQIAQALYTLPVLEPGPAVTLRDPAEVDAEAKRILRACDPSEPGSLTVARRLVYRAVATEEAPNAKRFYPHYAYEPPSGPTFAIPAHVTAPRVVIDIEATDATVNARASVTGGRGPFKITWQSCSTRIPRTGVNSPALTYTVAPRGLGERYTEILIAAVVDADGLQTVARAMTEMTPSAAPPAAPPARAAQAQTKDADGDGGEVGTYAIGPSQGLTLSYPNVVGFEATAAFWKVPVAVSKLEWEVTKEDFLDPAVTPGGIDSVDSVDLAFYTGHANGRGWTYFGTPSSKPLVGYDDKPRFGNGDLEWLVIAACGPLQPALAKAAGFELETAPPPPNGPEVRWLPTFDGLHAMFGFLDKSWQTALEGTIFGAAFLGPSLVPGQQRPRIGTGYFAWIWATVLTQPSGIRAGYLYPVSKSGRTNLEDKWDKVTPDIPADDIAYLVLKQWWT